MATLKATGLKALRVTGIDKVIGYIKDFHKTEFNPWLYGLTLLFLGIAIYVNYDINLENGIIDKYITQDIQILYYFIFFSIPYFLILFAYVFFHKKTNLLNNPGFWATIIFALLLLAFNSYFWQYARLARSFFPDNLGEWQQQDRAAYTYLAKVFWNCKAYFIYLIPFFLYKILFDREQKGFYGFTLKNFDARPYFTMLLIVLPLIIAASFQPSFQQAYPNYRPGVMEEAFGYSPWATTGLFQLAYGLDFISVEFFYRGFLVIGMVRFLGKGAVLPMVGVYCFLHFGKPMGETISSIFGGYILGIVAYYSKSIFGGIIVHMGVAWLMEFMAYLQLYVI